MQQFDLFDDSHVSHLRNDVIVALERRDPDHARRARHRLAAQYAADPALAPLQVLIDALQGPSAPLADHAALRAERLVLELQVEPAARATWDADSTAAWMRTLWRDLAGRAAALDFDPSSPEDHAAALWLRCGDWLAVVQAVQGIASWRRQPTPLAWMAQAQGHSQGLDAVWPLLAELAWMAPGRFALLLKRWQEPRLLRLKRRFDAEFDAADNGQALPPQPLSDSADGATDGDADLAWFPAWLLTEQPALAPRLAQAQPGQHRAPEQGLRLMVSLLHLEHDARHHALMAQRQKLRDLHAGLFAAYMKTR